MSAFLKNVILHLKFFVLFVQAIILFLEGNVCFLCDSMGLLLFGQGLAQVVHLTSLQNKSFLASNVEILLLDKRLFSRF